jgi:arylsulfatase A
MQTLRYWDPAIWQDGKLRTDVRFKYGEDVFCDFLIDFIGRNRERPFFVYYPMVLVHSPFEYTPDNKHALRWRSVNYFPDMVAYMDKTVGRIVATLDRFELREKTLLIFAGDNGTYFNITSKVGEQEVRGGKGTVTHLGTHVPLMASWPGTIPSGRVCTDLVDFSDVLPTMAELAGVDLPKGITFDGRSFAPQLFGRPGNPREWVFVQLGKERFVRDQRWLLHDDGRLYDIRADPSEQKKLEAADDADVSAAKERLHAVLEQLK